MTVAEPSASPNPGASTHKCACKKLRPYRRIHSLAGLLFGAFLAVHLGVAATAVSPSSFQANANVLHAVAERFPALELIALGIPLLVLIALGVHLLAEAGLSPTRKRCKRGGRVRYFLQRTSAVVILAFIAFHIATLSRWGLHGGLYDPSRAFASVAAALRANPAVEALYVLAIVAVSYHFANGRHPRNRLWHSRKRRGDARHRDDRITPLPRRRLIQLCCRNGQGPAAHGRSLSHTRVCRYSGIEYNC
jgi:succinate dehydrogenase/fumarate reductase cytochrome b subunit